LCSVWVAGTTVGCVEPVTVHAATNPAVSFDRYRTFTFGAPESPRAGYITSPSSPEVRDRLQPLITAGLTQRGYELAVGKGDLVITFGSGRRSVAVHESSGMGGEWLPDDENGTVVERSLAIDAFDAASGVRVWHGSSHAEIDPARVNQGMLQRAVTALFASFPMAKVSAP
jgi:hypothetical protein